MSQNTHKPGPWKVNEDGTSVSFDGGPKSEIILHPYEPRYPTAEEMEELGDDCHDDWFIGSAGGHFCDRPTEEVEANARLIAAAPELLEQLHAVLARLDMEPEDAIFPCSAMRDSIRAALAKAVK